MLEQIFQHVSTVAHGWQKDVDKRRKVTKTDPVADTIEYCASELLDAVEKLKTDTEDLTPAQFAELHGTTAQTVALWCRSGKLQAEMKGRGWAIPRSAVPPKKRSRSKK